MKFIVHGARSDDGTEQAIVVEATDERGAANMANDSGLLVSRVVSMAPSGSRRPARLVGAVVLIVTTLGLAAFGIWYSTRHGANSSATRTPPPTELGERKAGSDGKPNANAEAAVAAVGSKANDAAEDTTVELRQYLKLACSVQKRAIDCRIATP